MKTRMIQWMAAAAAVSLSLPTAGRAALTVSAIGESSIAGELRSLSRTDWATSNAITGVVQTTQFNLVRDDSSDNGVPFATFATGGAYLTIEELFSDAGYTNELRIKLGNTLLMSSKPLANLEGVRVKSDAPPESLDLVFQTNTAGPPDASAAGVVHLYDDANLRTYVYRDGNDTHYVWALEDKRTGDPGNDRDFNDYIFYARLSAVPEPSAIITGIAVGFLGLTVLRRRLSEKKTAA